MSKILNLLNQVQAQAAGDPSQPGPGGKTAGLSDEMVTPTGYYRMKKNPFADTVNPDFFFRTASQLDASRKLFASAEEGISLGLLTGPAGTGKTMVSQLLLQSLDRNRFAVVLVLVTPGMSKSVMLKEILKEFGLKDLPVRTRDRGGPVRRRPRRTTSRLPPASPKRRSR